jgi:hypothetical protein
MADRSGANERNAYTIMSTPRRTFLKGMAATLALPYFQQLRAAEVARAVVSPTRMAFIYIPNGVNLDLWRPTGSGADYGLSPTLEPLGDLRAHFSVLRGLDHLKAAANGDGAGDHARANATFLTGCQARKTAGADIRVGQSVDQIAAQALGGQTRLASLELSTDPPRSSGNCDSGYSCAYQFNLSWLNATTPAPAERDPRLVFEKMFGSGNPKEDARRRAYRKSILDFVSDDARRMQARLGSTDRDKMDEYLTATRDVEQRIERAEKFRGEVPENLRPNGVPDTYSEHMRLMFDMMHLAFQTDTTRVSSFLLAHDGSNHTFNEIGIPSAHHELSHHRGNPQTLEMIGKIDRFYIEQLAYFLRKLRDTEENGQSLLDHSMIVYGGGIGDGNRHNHDDLPVLLAGHGGGNLKPGRLIEAPKGTPMTNLYLSLLDRMGVKADRVGDSTGEFADV